ncbi:MAG: Holliday junction resolvase-like protein [archaeon]
MADFFVFALLGFLLLLVLTVFFLFRQNRDLNERLKSLSFQKASQSVKYGKLTEQFIPFTEEFPFSPSSFRFIGTPIDGVAFADGKIFFCEFKAASSNLSFEQRRIKKLVEEKKVEWFDFRLR